MRVLTPLCRLKRVSRIHRNAVTLNSRAFSTAEGDLPTEASMKALSHQHWLDESSGIYKNFLNGKFVESSASSFYPVVNPATNEEIGKIPETPDSEFEAVMATAQAAYEDWRTVPVQQRQRVMLEYQRLIRENTNELAGLITLENGKTIADAKGDVFRGLEVVETACQAAPQLLGDSLAGIGSTIDCISYREPMGVCAGIGEFNYDSHFLIVYL